MRILYGIQGTGHGHISRARVLLPLLREYAEVDVLISGYNFKINIEGDIAYTARGLSLVYDSKGSIDFFKTVRSINLVRLWKDINSVPIDNYDFVINDFEPVTAWAASRAGIPCVAVSHQVSFLSSKSPRPAKKSFMAEQLIKYFAPSSAAVGSHYLRYDDYIEPPVIRKQIKELNPMEREHFTVYLPAFDQNRLCSIFTKIGHVKWQIFSADCESTYRIRNVEVFPISKEKFLESIENCSGIVSSAGFETTSEAMYLGKKLLTIPIQNQYEQICNAAALEKMGGKVVYRIKKDFPEVVRKWIEEDTILTLPEVSEENNVVLKILAAGRR